MEEYAMLKLDNQLCFRLYTASRNVVRRYAPYLKPLGLTYTQYLAMMVLWEQERVTVTGLCKRLGLETSTVTPLLKKLEADGLVIRTRSERDERVCEVVPTQRGWELREQAAKVPACMADDLCVDIETIEQLAGLLDKFNEQVETSGSKQGARDGIRC